MGRLATWLVVAGVAVVGVFATVDAFGPGSSDARPTRIPADPYTARLAAELEAAGVRGVLYFADRRCGLHGLRLPSLRPAAPPDRARCRLTANARTAARLGDSRLAAILARRKKVVIAVLEHRRIVAKVPWFESRSARFYVSPRGSFFAVVTDAPDRFFLLDRDGAPGLPNVARFWFDRTSVRDARAIAWSPDERWAALVKGESIYIFTTRDEDPRPYLVRLPFAARDVAWY